MFTLKSYFDQLDFDPYKQCDFLDKKTELNI